MQRRDILLDDLERPLLDEVEALASRHGDRLALSFREEHWTVEQVASRARAIAGAIAARVEVGDVVVVSSSDPMLRHAAYLAVGRVGGIALGLSPGEDVPRAARQVELARPVLVVHDGDLTWAQAIAPTLPHEEIRDLAGRPGTALPRSVGPAHPCELTYTSGTTGDPKPVFKTHHGVTRGWRHIGASLGVEPGDRAGHIDVGAFGGIWGHPTSSMLLGASTHFFPLHQEGPGRLADWLEREAVNWIMAVPSVYRLLLTSLDDGRAFDDIKWLHFGGEAAHASDVLGLRKHLRPEALILGGYGTSEHHLLAWGPITAADCDAGGVLPSGWPIAGQPFTLLDREGEPTPPGEIGLLHVTGRHFCAPSAQPPQLESGDPAPERFEATGDEARILEDGRVVVVGRADDALNIAGTRIDPSEIEAALTQHPSVREAAAMSDESGESVVAVVSSQPGSQLTEDDVRSHARTHLHGARLPARFVLMEDLPHLPGGKLDRRAIRSMLAEMTSHDAGASGPSGADTPSVIARLMAQVLDRAVKVDDDFFALGGTSLQAARLYAQIYRDLDVDLPLATLLEAPTPTLLAALIEHHDEGPKCIVTIREGDPSLTPVFISHGAMGNVLFVQHIAAGIPEPRPVYAIQAPYLDGRRPTERTLEQLALRYVGAVQAIQPEGPYALVGYSFGGYVVAEMARHLHDTGHDLALVALGDTVGPHTHVVAQPLRVNAPVRVGLHRDNLAQMRSPGELAAYVRRLSKRRFQRAVGRLVKVLQQGDRAVPPPVRPWATAIHGRRLAGAYRPAPYPVPLTMFRATESAGTPGRGWEDLAPKGLDIVWIDGDHKALRSPEVGPRFGEAIEQALSQGPA